MYFWQMAPYIVRDEDNIDAQQTELRTFRQSNQSAMRSRDERSSKTQSMFVDPRLSIQEEEPVGLRLGPMMMQGEVSPTSKSWRPLDYSEVIKADGGSVLYVVHNSDHAGWQAGWQLLGLIKNMQQELNKNCSNSSLLCAYLKFHDLNAVKCFVLRIHLKQLLGSYGIESFYHGASWGCVIGLNLLFFF